MKVLRFPERPREQGVYRSGRTDGGSEILTARDDDGTYLGELVVGAHMSRNFARSLLDLHRRAWLGKAGPRQRERARRRVLPTALALGLVTLLTLPWTTSHLGADHGSASLLPAGPSGFTVTYTPPTTLAGSQLRLVGYYRTGEDRWYARPEIGAPFAAHLARIRGGSYQASVTLPPEAIYAAFWIESPSAEDRNLGALYHYSNGSLQAEVDRLRTIEYLAGTGDALWSTFFQVADQISAAHPLDPEISFLQLMHERRTGRRGQDEVNQRFMELHRYWVAAPRVGRRELEGLVSLAGLTNRVAEREHWTTKLLSAYPDSRTARSVILDRAHERRGPDGFMEVADSLWAEDGRLDYDFVLAAAELAERSDNPTRAERWRVRLAEFRATDGDFRWAGVDH